MDSDSEYREFCALSKDVRKHALISRVYMDKILAERRARAAELRSMLTDGQRSDDALEDIRNILNVVLAEIYRGEQMIVNRQVASEQLCDGKSYWIDWVGYYREKHDDAVEQLQHYQDLRVQVLGKTNRAVLLKLLERDISRTERAIASYKNKIREEYKRWERTK